MKTTTQLRAEYKAMRDAAKDKARFDSETRAIAHEISDGEETTPETWVYAAKIALNHGAKCYFSNTPSKPNR